jgi:hypothetical protein
MESKLPTPGRIVMYVLATEDHPHPGLVGKARPAIVVDMATVNPETFDLVVFTRGTKDFAVGRPGCDGTLVVSDAALAEDASKAKPGDIFWPVRA